MIASRTSGAAGAPAFSLIEVVIAVALFAAAATVLTTSFVNTVLLREKGQSDERFAADLHAVRLQLLLEPNRDDAEEGGEYPSLNHGEALWRAEVEPTDVVDLFQVRFEVEFTDPPENGRVAYAETLYLLRPTWSEGDERSQLLEDKRDALLDSRRFDRF